MYLISYTYLKAYMYLKHNIHIYGGRYIYVEAGIYPLEVVLSLSTSWFPRSQPISWSIPLFSRIFHSQFGGFFVAILTVNKQWLENGETLLVFYKGNEVIIFNFYIHIHTLMNIYEYICLIELGFSIVKRSFILDKLINPNEPWGRGGRGAISAPFS